MNGRTHSTGAKVAVFALAASSALALAGCSEHSYPSAGPTAAPQQDEAALAGAPTTRSPEYAPPQPGGPYGAPGYPPPPNGMDGAPPPPGYPPPPPAPPSGLPEIVTMRPIPNPPEPAPGEMRLYHHHHHEWRRYGWAPAYAAPAYEPYGYHRHRHHAYGRATMHGAMIAAPASHPHAAAHAAPMAKAPPSTAPAAQLPKPAAPDHHRHHKHAAAGAAAGAATAAAASGGSTKVGDTANQTGNVTGSEADRYQALEQALKQAFGSSAELKAPAHMEANQPAVVTLTLPSGFAATVKAEAAKQGLGDAASTVNLTAALTGDGYTITPDQPQSQPLTQDTVTSFSWKVTPTTGGRSALKAAVRAQLVGAGHDLDLGSKSTGSASATGRVVGIGLLALIALVLLGWAAQRRRPAPTGAVKPRTANFDNPPRP